MYLLAWIFIGAVVGWGAGRDFRGKGYGLWKDVVMGIGGVVGGGFLIGSGGYRGTILTSLFAVIAAGLLANLPGFANGRRIYAQQA